MRGAGAVIATLALLGSASAQIHDDVILYGANASGYAILRFDRRLTLLSSTTVPSPNASLENGCPIATDGVGGRWVCAAALGPTTLMRVDHLGNLLPSVTLATNPVGVTAAADGRVFALTRVPLSSPGPMYGVNANGSIAWASMLAPSLYTLVYPRRLCVTTSGQLWVGDVTPPHGQFWADGLLLQIDPDSGAILQQLQLPDLTGTGDEAVTALVGDLDGAFWAAHSGGADGMHLEHWDGLQLVQSFPIQGGSNPFCFFVRLDGAGRLYVVSKWADQAGEFGTKIFRYDPADSGVMDASWDLGRTIVGYALGATGDSVYAVVNSNDFPFPRRLARLNLTTGVQSTVPLEPTWLDDTITDGDPTGFIYANVVDRNGDNDGDGIRNGVETAAGSNPFDPLSRPDGPKVYISFAQSNGAISLKYVDPDGLLDPTGGLNLASLSLVSSQQGEIFNYLLPFLTFVQLSPDQTEVTAFFGALPIPPDKKWQFEATVADKTGATGWDWQVTRPGDL